MRPPSFARPHPLLAAWLFLLITPSSRATEDVDYLRDVRPILARHCVTCHGADKPRAGLRLDSAAAALAGNASGPSILPGQPDESPLWLSVSGAEGFERMPLKRPPLSSAEQDTLRRWIAAGAGHPESETPITAEHADTHWAFRAPVRPPLPAVQDQPWSRNPIDRFLRARQESAGLSPSPEADRPTLLRRASLDLVGLPPLPEEQARFLADDRPDAYSRLIDRLLASPHYGERRARLWLDLARYADSNGYSIDAPRSIWPYRDWVLNASNADLPFNQFTIDQLAGDLKPNPSLEDQVATGFHRNTPINQEGGVDPEQFRVESVIDRVATTGAVWLGLTISCAQCHDHKYDPLSQNEYYQLFAFFNDDDEPELSVASRDLIARRERLQAELDQFLQSSFQADPTLKDRVRAWELAQDPSARQKLPQAVRAVFDVPFPDRSDNQHLLVFASFVDAAPEAAELRSRARQIRASMPEVPATLVLARRAQPRETRFFIQGDFTRPGDPVQPGVPSVLHPLDAATGSRRPDRMDLARWLVDPRNPLTARVVVNRVWQRFFGRGLVETENDFGTQGSPPTHPELLDWLAVEFMEQGWSIKHLERLIVTSAAYRQASRARPDLDRLDPRNELLARQNRIRLDAELVRDSALLVSGLLARKLGGPPVYPPQPPGVTSLGQINREWITSTGPDRYRRAIYTFLWRGTPHPALVTFDAPEGTKSCTRRERSNTPLQSLILLNDEAFVECARTLAEHVLAEAPPNTPARLQLLFERALGRSPAPEEIAIAHDLLAAEMAADPHREAAAWFALARAVLNTDEFITRE
jgi:mono/diheme cytochrome c family protein